MARLDGLGLRAVGEVDLDAHADDLLAGLGEEGALLTLEEAAGGAGAHLGEVVGGRGGEHGHEVVAGGRGGVVAVCGVGGVGEVDVAQGARGEGTADAGVGGRGVGHGGVVGDEARTGVI